MSYRLFVILALLAQAPKPLPTPPKTETTGIMSDGTARWCITDSDCKIGVAYGSVFTMASEDIPVGPCDLVALVRAMKTHLSLEHDSWQLKQGAAWTEHQQKRSEEMDDLNDQLARCSPKEGKQ